MTFVQDSFRLHLLPANIVLCVHTVAFAVLAIYNVYIRDTTQQTRILLELATLDMFATFVSLFSAFIPLINASFCPYNLTFDLFGFNAGQLIFLNRVAYVLYAMEPKIQTRLTIALMGFYVSEFTTGVIYIITNTGYVKEPTNRTSFSCATAPVSPGVSGAANFLSSVILMASFLYIVYKGLRGFVRFYRQSELVQSGQSSMLILKLVFIKMGIEFSSMVMVLAIEMIASLENSIPHFVTILVTRLLALYISLAVFAKLIPTIMWRQSVPLEYVASKVQQKGNSLPTESIMSTEVTT